MKITKNILLTPLFLLFFSCSQEPLVTDLQFDEGIATYDGDLYTGSAKSFYDSENTTIKTISNYTEGFKTSFESFSENGDLKIKEFFKDNNLVQRIYYAGDSSFIIQKFNNNELVETNMNSLECDSTCTITDLNLENLSLTDFTLRNVVFKNSSFKNVKFVSEDIENNKALAILDSVTFKDSKLIDVIFEDVLFLSDASNKNFQKAMCIDRYGEDYPESSLQNCIDDNRYSIDNEIDKFPLTLVLDNVNGGVIFQSVSLEKNVGSLEILNSSLDNFAFTFFSKLPKRPALFINNTNIKYVDELVIGSTRVNSGKVSGPYAGKVYTSLKLKENSISCDNSSIENGNLLYVLSMCEDFSENFDEFALRDFEKTYIPDNSIYRISKYLESDNYTQKFSSSDGYQDSGYDSYYFGANEANQRYALASGDKDWLLNYFKDLLEYALFDRQGSINEINPCDDSNLLYFTRYSGRTPENCSDQSLGKRTFADWYYIPEESRTVLGEEIMELMVYYFPNDSKAKKLKETKFKSFNFSDNGKKQALQKYVDKRLNFDGMKNCLRGSHVNTAREVLDTVYSINQYTSDRYNNGPETRYIHLKQNEFARNSDEVKKISECIENNISIYSPQVMSAYKPFSDLVMIAYNELEIFEDEERRLEAEARKLRIAKRNALYKTFLESGLGDDCNLGTEIINAYYSGNAESKQRRVDYAEKACQRCKFNFWASTLNDADFENFITGKDKNPESAKSMGVADITKLFMCPVAGADRKIQIMYENFLN